MYTPKTKKKKVP